MVTFVLSYFPRDVLGGIWDLVQSVSKGFPTYSFKIALYIKGPFSFPIQNETTLGTYRWHNLQNHCFSLE